MFETDTGPENRLEGIWIQVGQPLPRFANLTLDLSMSSFVLLRFSLTPLPLSALLAD